MVQGGGLAPDELQGSEALALHQRLEAFEVVVQFIEALPGGSGQHQVPCPGIGQCRRQLGFQFIGPPAEQRDDLANFIASLIGTTQSADISLFKNFGESTGLHVSSHSLGRDAMVEFDRLDILPHRRSA